MEVGTGKLGSGELDVELRTLELRGWVRWFSGDLHTFSSRMRCALFVFVFLFREIAGERFGIYYACLSFKRRKSVCVRSNKRKIYFKTWVLCMPV